MYRERMKFCFLILVFFVFTKCKCKNVCESLKNKFHFCAPVEILEHWFRNFDSGIRQGAEAMVSIKRLQNFMLYDEVEDIKGNQKKIKVSGLGEETKQETERAEMMEFRREKMSNEGSVILERCHAKWLNSDTEDTLRGINFRVKPGQLVAVVGQVGSGKSSLLNIILKELPIRSGTLKVQQIRKNIKSVWNGRFAEN